MFIYSRTCSFIGRTHAWEVPPPSMGAGGGGRMGARVCVHSLYGVGRRACTCCVFPCFSNVFWNHVFAHTFSSQTGRSHPCPRHATMLPPLPFHLSHLIPAPVKPGWGRVCFSWTPMQKTGILHELTNTSNCICCEILKTSCKVSCFWSKLCSPQKK